MKLLYFPWLHCDNQQWYTLSAFSPTSFSFWGNSQNDSCWTLLCGKTKEILGQREFFLISALKSLVKGRHFLILLQGYISVTWKWWTSWLQVELFLFCITLVACSQVIVVLGLLSDTLRIWVCFRFLMYTFHSFICCLFLDHIIKS